MLALIASRVPDPAQETADRDPGFLTLAFALARALRWDYSRAWARHVALMNEVGGPRPF
jgi:hypothetical protein